MELGNAKTIVSENYNTHQAAKNTQLFTISKQNSVLSHLSVLDLHRNLLRDAPNGKDADGRVGGGEGVIHGAKA